LQTHLTRSTYIGTTQYMQTTVFDQDSGYPSSGS
jgi:hypothetical protein